MITLLDGVSANTNGDAVNLLGGALSVFVQGTDFGGGTVTLEVSVDGGTVWHTAKQQDGVTDLTASGNSTFVMWGYAAGVAVRATLTGASGADTVSVFLVGQE